MCKSGASHLPRAEEQGNVNIFSPRVEGIHNLAVSSGTLIPLLILIVGYVLVKTGVVTCCRSNNRNTVQMQRMDREEEQKRAREESPSHRVDMLPVHQVAALMNEAREENMALKMQIRASRSELTPTAPISDDSYKHV